MPVQLVLEDFFPAARRSFKVASLRTIKFVASVNAVDDEVTHLKIKIKDQFIRTNKQTNKQTHTHTHTRMDLFRQIVRPRVRREEPFSDKFTGPS